MNGLKRYLFFGAHTRICIGCLTAVLLMLACSSKDDGYTPLLREAEAVMENDADSALCMLEEAEGSYTNASEAKRMRYRLLRAKAQNKAYVDFTSDEEMKQVVDYYDKLGSKNDRLLAHYLLGCVYRDLGEAPMAVDCYQQAISLADTTSVKCDLRTLSCVYSQLAAIYNSQLLFSENIAARRKSLELSERVGDTIIAAYERLQIANTMMVLNNDSLAEIELFKVKETLEGIGQQQMWINMSTALMFLWSRNIKDRDALRDLINKYETCSTEYLQGLQGGKRQFYYYKGLLYEDEGKLDSAELCYRLIYSDNMDYTVRDVMNRGLLSVYGKRNVPDSIAKYAKLFCEANDSSILVTDRELTANMAAMYRYGRFQHEAAESKMQAAESHRKLSVTIAVSALLFSLLTCIIFFLLWRKRRKKQEMQQIRMQYVEVRDELASKLSELDEIEHFLDSITAMFQRSKDGANATTVSLLDIEESKETLLKSNKEKAQELIEYIRKLSEEKVLEQYINRSEKFKSQDVVKRFYSYADNPTSKISRKDWKELYAVFDAFYPKLMSKVRAQFSNADITKSVCLLTVMGIRTSDIANMLNTTLQSVTNTKSQANKDLFGQTSAKTLRKNLELEYNIYI